MGNIAVVAIILFISVTLTLDIFAMDGDFITAIKDGIGALSESVKNIFNDLP